MTEAKIGNDELFVHCPHCRMPVFNDIHLFSGAKIEVLPPKPGSTDELAVLSIGTFRGVVPIGVNEASLLALSELIQSYLKTKRN